MRTPSVRKRRSVVRPDVAPIGAAMSRPQSIIRATLETSAGNESNRTRVPPVHDDRRRARLLWRVGNPFDDSSFAKREEIATSQGVAGCVKFALHRLHRLAGREAALLAQLPDAHPYPS